MCNHQTKRSGSHASRKRQPMGRTLEWRRQSCSRHGFTQCSSKSAAEVTRKTHACRHSPAQGDVFVQYRIRDGAGGRTNGGRSVGDRVGITSTIIEKQLPRSRDVVLHEIEPGQSTLILLRRRGSERLRIVLVKNVCIGSRR